MTSSVSSSAVGGIISGLDTEAIIEASLEIYSQQIENLEVDQLELDVQEQAYLIVYNLLSEFNSTVESLADDDLWNTCAASSSNSDSLTASLDEYASEGTYTFEVLQLAQSGQSTSTGVSSQTDSVNPSQAGTITLESTKASLSSGTSLSLINNGEGISHGIISITDSDGDTEQIDLRAALTMNDVVNAINDSGLEVTAAISEDGNSLVLTDNNGGSFKIADSSGSTAEDLGIKGTFTGTVIGDEVYGLNTTTTLSQLNDGQGVNDGTAGIITITNSTTGDAWDIDLSSCTTIGHVISMIENETGGAVGASISSDGRSLKLTGETGANLIVSSAESGDTTAEDLGIATEAAGAGESYTGGKLLADMNSVRLSSLSGLNGEGLNGTRGEYGADLGEFAMNVNGTDIVFDLDAAYIKSDDSLTEMLNYLNQTAADAGYAITFEINAAGNGLQIVNESGYAATFSNSGTSTIAADLGLAGITVDGAETLDAGNLERNYVSRATSLETLNGGDGVDSGSFLLTDAGGFSAEIDTTDCETVGDIIAAINGSGLDIVAAVNDSGDGIMLTSTNTSTGTISFEEVDGGTCAKDLGFLYGTAGTTAGGNATLDGSFEINIDVSTTDSLTDIMNTITSRTSYDAYIINDGSEYSPYHLAVTSDSTGAASNFVISSSISSLGFSQTTTGQDSLLLYGSQTGDSEPLLMRSSTNSNNSVVKGMPLELSSISNGEVTITVSRDNETIVEAVQAMVDAYNDLNSTILDMMTYVPDDEETTTSDDEDADLTGLLYGDSSTRQLLESINDMFMSIQEGNTKLRMFRDLGISFSLDEEEDSDGDTSYSTSLNFDSDTFEEYLESDFDEMKSFFCNSGNAALASNGAEINISGQGATGFSAEDLINGNTSSSDFGVGNGYQAADTIENGDDTVTINFADDTLLDYLVIYHIDSESMPADKYALSDFTVEYLNSETGKWITLREVEDNTSSYTVISSENPVYASAIRLTATGTNAEDGIMRLVEIQVESQSGVASEMANSLASLLDSETGYYATKSNLIDTLGDDIDDEIERITSRMNSREAVMWSQFTAMELTLASLQTQSDYFTSVMSSITGSSE